MKWMTLCRKVYLSLVIVAWAGLVVAAPRYTDKDNALKLSDTLDKGIYQNQLITSTFIQSAGKGRYFIKVILDNGAQQNWDLIQIHALSKNESIVLKNNRALIFPDENLNEFVPMDKNLFSEQALTSRVYVKYYPPSDVLAGQKINFGLHRFNLVDLLSPRKRYDDQGYRYHYILDLENGQREILSFLGAYQTLEKKGLIQDPSLISPVMRSPYRLQSIKKHELLKEGNTGIGHFSVEMIFDRPVELEPGHYPFKFFERGGRGRLHKNGGSNFVVEITAPNAEMLTRIPTIETLEFLHNIRAVKDPINQKRILLQANLNPEVMGSPPMIVVSGNSVSVAFTKVVDQSVFNQKEIEENDYRMRQERLLSRNLSTAEVEKRQTYRGHMKKGEEFRYQAHDLDSFRDKIETLRKALNEFKQAAQYSSSDRELRDSLRERNNLNVNIPAMTVNYVRKALKKKSAVDFQWLKTQLENSALMTRDRHLLETIKSLLKLPQFG